MEQGLPCPRAIMCIHEHVAVSAAHGYYLATRRPQVVQVHVDLGTINAGGSLHNAQRANAGVVFTAGRVPYASTNGVPGAMDSGIFFYQEQLDQAGIVRNFTKWQYELTRPESVVVRPGARVPAGRQRARRSRVPDLSARHHDAARERRALSRTHGAPTGPCSRHSRRTSCATSPNGSPTPSDR